jgi:hypothetical protein
MVARLKTTYLAVDQGQSREMADALRKYSAMVAPLLLAPLVLDPSATEWPMRKCCEYSVQNPGGDACSAPACSVPRPNQECAGAPLARRLGGSSTWADEGIRRCGGVGRGGQLVRLGLGMPVGLGVFSAQNAPMPTGAPGPTNQPEPDQPSRAVRTHARHCPPHAPLSRTDQTFVHASHINL